MLERVAGPSPTVGGSGVEDDDGANRANTCVYRYQDLVLQTLL